MSGSKLITALSNNVTDGVRGTVRRKAAGCSCCPSCADNDTEIMRDASGPGPHDMAVSQPGDRAEVEADRAAHAVMSQASPAKGTPIAPTTHRAGGVAGGAPLPEGTRSYFEPRFGHSFSAVRVFHDSSAAEAAESLQANAFTIGPNIVFGAGRWSPESSDGQRLLAHELAHVVQQESSPSLQRKIMRDACKHDDFKSGGCSGIRDTSGDDPMLLATDNLIVALGLKRHFGGTWLSQVYTPLNPRKCDPGKKSGRIDALKVKEGSSLSLEILEIKSRNLKGGCGGCVVASDESEGYKEALDRIETRMHEVALRLANIGGYMIPDKDGSTECRSSAAKKELKGAGLNPQDDKTMMAWCVYNSIQTRLGKAFTTRFKAINIDLNRDGKPAQNKSDGYDVMSWRSGSCGKNSVGRKYMRFQVNGKGGLSYRCDKRCVNEEEQERERNDETRVWDYIDQQREKSMGKDKSSSDEPRVPLDKRAPPPPGKRDSPVVEVSPDVDPYEEGAEIPSHGVSAADVVTIGIIGTGTVYALHLAHQAAKTQAEKVILEKARDRVLNELRRKGAAEVAKKLNSANLKKFGTKAYEKMIDEAEAASKRIGKGIEKNVEKRLIRKVGGKIAKKVLEKGVRYLPIVGAVLTAAKVFGIANAVAAGAEIEIGLGGDDVDVSGDSKVKKGKAGSNADGDVDIKDTKIELEVDGAPGQSGSLEIKAENVKISGKAATEGDAVTVDLKINISNSTIVVRSEGIYKGSQIEISGNLDIIDSDITIDLPKGTVLAPPKKGEKRVIKGVKVVIKKAGTGEGHGGGGGKGTGPSSDSKGEGVPGMESKDKPAENMPKLSPGARKQLEETYKDPNTKKVADLLLSAKANKEVSEEMLKRLNALKDQLAKHQQLLEEFLKQAKKKPGSDPLKDVIEPLEELLRNADKPKPDTTVKPPDPKDPASSQDVKSPGDSKAVSTSKPPLDKSKATPIEMRNGKNRLTFDKENDPSRTREDVIDGVASLTRLVVDVERTYRIRLKGVYAGPLSQTPTPPAAGVTVLWGGMYTLTVPDGVFKSTDGVDSIYFTDVGKKFEKPYVVWGSPGSKTRKK
jgi:hypothetical protein